MRKIIPYVLVLLLVLIGAVYYLNSTSTGEGEELAAPRSNRGGMVDISFTFLNPVQTQYKDVLAFQVSMNTHSVDLDKYDIKNITYLRSDGGQVTRPVDWVEASGSGGHHRSGILLFPMTDPNIKNGGFQIIMESVSGLDRIFSW